MIQSDQTSVPVHCDVTYIHIHTCPCACAHKHTYTQSLKVTTNKTIQSDILGKNPDRYERGNIQINKYSCRLQHIMLLIDLLDQKSERIWKNRTTQSTKRTQQEQNVPVFKPLCSIHQGRPYPGP